MTRFPQLAPQDMTPAQREVLREVGEGLVAPDATATGPFRVVATDVRADRNRAGHNVVSYYAASIGVMFLLFTMVTATRGLGVEVETGTLERLLGTRVGMGQLLFARWLFAAALGCVQLIVMFGWAWMVFGVDVIAPGHAAGVLVMTVASAAAAAAFGLVLGTACRTPAQLQGLATVVIRYARRSKT